MIKHFRMLGMALAASALIACSALGIQTQTFNEKYAAGVATATAALSTTDTLLKAGKITAADAKNTEAQIDNVKEALDLANTAYATDQATGNNKLAAALTTLQALQTYLTTKGK